MKRTILATAMTAALGTGALPEYASATQFTFSYTGWFTMIDPSGVGFNNSNAIVPPYYGWRTPVTGTMVFDDTTNSGTLSIGPFSFAGGGNAAATSITFADIDGPGGAGTLLLGNMGFNWSGNNGIPVSIVWDAQGLLDALGQGPAVGDTINSTGPATFACGTNITCATPATDSVGFGAKQSYTLPIGPSPMVTTTFNTTDIGTVALGTNPSGTLPLTDDGIGGSPMKAGPFPSFNANFDFDSMTLISDGSGSITAPANISDTVAQTPPPPGRTQAENLGAPTNVVPTGSAEYCLTGKTDCDTNNSWVANDGTNTINVPVDQTVNTLVVDWRAGGGTAFATQNVTVTVDDTTPPTIDSTPADVSVNVQSISDKVCFAGGTIGYLTASDIWDSSPSIEYSLDGFTYFPSNPSPGEDCSTDFPSGTSFGPNANTVTWRAEDTSGNSALYQQTVTLNLPTGIVGKACEVNLDYSGFRNTAGDFIMRDPTGAQTGSTDTGVTGVIDTTKLCTDPSCANLAPDIAGATLDAGQPFQGLLWKAEPVTLFGVGQWSFNACPGDQSTQCDGPPQPRLLDMTVKSAAENSGVPQLGAHMLFQWGNTQDIDVVVVWDVDCGAQQLTTTDPDGDGIPGTKMVDGPFIGFNAAFNISATGVDPNGDPVPLISDGGYLVSIPAYQNSTPNSSPLPLDATEIPVGDLPTDSVATESCVGGCFTFETTGLIDASDSNGAYQAAVVVLPQSQPIPFWSLYRKFDATTNQWRTFTADARNNVQSAPFDESDLCPEPGSPSYNVADSNSLLAGKLQAGDNCIQLTIEDNGPNDSNPAVGTVADPSGVAAVPEPPLPDPATKGDFTDSNGGCTIVKTPVDPMKRTDWWLVTALLGWFGFSSRRRPSR